MNYVVRLEQFEGPLDLLLYLIQREEMDIYDIPIARITEQYLHYIEAMDRLDLHPAGEFLVMAATLLRIKARMLLPIQRPGDENEEDPRAELVLRLLEYKKFKEAARKLEQREAERALQYTRALDPNFVEEMKKDGDEVTFEVSMAELVKALTAVLSRFEEVATHEVRLESVSLEERMDYLRRRLQERQRLSWSEMFGDTRSRLEVIVTFIAILELAKGGVLQLHQADNTSEIWVWRRTDAAPDRAPSPHGEA